MTIPPLLVINAVMIGELARTAIDRGQPGHRFWRPTGSGSESFLLCQSGRETTSPAAYIRQGVWRRRNDWDKAQGPSAAKNERDSQQF